MLTDWIYYWRTGVPKSSLQVFVQTLAFVSEFNLKILFSLRIQMHEKVLLSKIEQIASTVKSPNIHGLIGCDHSLAIWLWGHIYIFSPFGVFSNAHCQHFPNKKLLDLIMKLMEKNINENSSNAADCDRFMNGKCDGSKFLIYSNSSYLKLTAILISSHSANTIKYFLDFLVFLWRTLP